MKRRRRKQMQTSAAEVLETRALLSASTLDTTFGVNGLADLGVTRGFDAEIADDGKIVVGGSRNSVGTVTRYNADGSLDTTFGTDGVAAIPGMHTVTDVELLPNGQILAGGSRFETRMFRLNSDGSVDPDFDAPLFVQAGPYFSMEVDSQGRIYTNHSAGLGTALLNRHNPDGSLDIPFGTSNFGTQYAPGRGIFDFLQDMTLDSETRPVAVNGSGVYRFTTEGFVDTSFSDDGLVNSIPSIDLTTIEITDSGVIYVGGYDRTDFNNLTGVVLAYDDAGNEIYSATTPEVVFALELQADGRVVVASGNPDGSDFEATLTRFNSDLTVDSTFGTPGVGVALSSMFDLEIDAENRFVAVGASATTGAENFVTRFTPGNYAPEANDDGNNVTEDATPNTATGDVIANDTDFNTADVLTVTEVDSTAGNVGATIPLDYGTVVINADGTYTYTLDNSNADVQALNAMETLTENISYSIADADGETSTADLTITIDGADEDEASTPLEQVNEIIDDIFEIYNDGGISARAGNWLLVSLYRARAHISAGNNSVAQIHLRRFRLQVVFLFATNQLDFTDAQGLFGLATDLISDL